jgi:hypothetical protein
MFEMSEAWTGMKRASPRQQPALVVALRTLGEPLVGLLAVVETVLGLGVLVAGELAALRRRRGDKGNQAQREELAEHGG